MDYDGPDPLEEQIENFRNSIGEIEEDIAMRVREADHNFISGLCKLISTCRECRIRSHLMFLLQQLNMPFTTLDGLIASLISRTA